MHVTNRGPSKSLREASLLRPEPMAVGAGAGGLIERDAALATLQRLLYDSAAGRGRLAIVDGPTGGGKSALMHSFLEAAADEGAVTLSATASHRERMLPYGVLAQLLATTRIPRALLAAVSDRLDMMIARERAANANSEAMSVETIQDFHQLSRALADLAQTVPLVIAIDNLHQVDTPSLRCVSAVVPRLTSARVLVLLTDDVTIAPYHSPLRSELYLQPNLHRISLNLLTEQGVARLITRQLGDAAAHRLARDFAAISGGNPLVLQSLVFDHESGAGRYPQGYGRVLLRCLRQGAPADLVRALAVLGDDATPTRLARLAGVPGDDVARTLNSLTAAGLLDGNAFRHPVAASLVLDDMPASARSDLRGRAAELLHDEGAPVLRIAEQLIDAGEVRASWAAVVLQAAAAEALLDNRVLVAVDYLRLAERTSADIASRAVIRSRLNRMEWLLKPTVADRGLTSLVDDVSSGDLDADETIDLLWRLSWYGRIHEVADVLEVLRGRLPRGSNAATLDTSPIATWLTYMYPLTARTRGVARSDPMATTDTTLRSGPWLVSAGALADGLICGRVDDLASTAHRVLRSFRLDHGSLWSGESGLLALLSLVYTEQLDSAASWCDQLLADADTRGTPAWQAVFTGVRAEIALRQGDLPTAYGQAVRALTLMPASGWGVALGLPWGCLVLAAVRMGRVGVAEQYVAQTVPDMMLQSRYGLHYLYARGHYRLAMGQPQPALADFLSCEELTEGWGIAGAGTVPWRTGAAEAWLQLGNPDQAKRLVRDQLARLPPDNSRARGLSLRMLAAVSGVTRRPQLLTDAVDVLSDCGDTFELARALTDLSSAYRQVGDRRNARRTAHRAWRLAKGSGAESLCREAVPGGEPTFEPLLNRRPEGPSTLTKQQRRVAALAAEGYTNEEIAERLFITASTVEQHLTRVFRKLGIKGRQELPRRLHARSLLPHSDSGWRAG